MKTPTTKVDLLKQMHASRQEFYATVDDIPEEMMAKTALYNAWTIKDLIAHLAGWEQSLADRIAAYRRGEEVPFITEEMVDVMNAQFIRRYQDMELYEVRALEASAFAALEYQVIEAADAEIFEPGHFPGLEIPLLDLIAGDTYEHYAGHIADMRDWLRQNGIQDRAAGQLNRNPNP